MSRLATISDSSGTLAAYKYLGAGTIVKESRPNVSGGLNLNYDPDGNNSFSGFDRFGRVVDQLWANDTGTPIDEYKYGFDRAGNVAWKQNAGPSASGLDELYAYDEVYRLIGTERGTLDFTDPDNPTITSQTKYQDWTLDGLGNFSEFDDNGSTQTRDVNAANEITSTSGIATPAYEAAGNMTSDGTLKYEYDAWNRLVHVRQADDTPVATYAYDGHNHRVSKALADGATKDYYYNQQWQLVEEWTQTGSTTAVNQYVWDESYIDAPLVRFHDGNGDGDCVPATDADDTICYCTWDANHNVTAVLAAGATVLHRHVFDAYGKVTVYSPTWTSIGTAATDGPLYAGYWFDAETGNSLARNRFYSMELATFISRDPIGYAGGVGLYRYASNSPIQRVDPSGTEDGPDGRPIYRSEPKPQCPAECRESDSGYREYRRDQELEDEIIVRRVNCWSPHPSGNTPFSARLEEWTYVITEYYKRHLGLVQWQVICVRDAVSQGPCGTRSIVSHPCGTYYSRIFGPEVYVDKKYYRRDKTRTAVHKDIVNPSPNYYQRVQSCESLLKD